MPYMEKPIDTKPVLRSIATTKEKALEIYSQELITPESITAISTPTRDEIKERMNNLPSHYELPPNPITGIGQIADIARQLSQLCTEYERETNKGCL